MNLHGRTILLGKHLLLASLHEWRGTAGNAILKSAQKSNFYHVLLGTEGIHVLQWGQSVTSLPPLEENATIFAFDP